MHTIKKIIPILALLACVSCDSMLGDMANNIPETRQRIMLMLSGVFEPLPELALVYGGRQIIAGELVDMGFIYQGATKTLDLTVKNIGRVDVTIQGVVPYGRYADRFSVSGIVAPVTLLPDQETPVSVSFTSDTPNDGYKAAVISIDTGPDFAPYNVTFACERIEIEQAKFELWRGFTLVPDGSTCNMGTVTTSSTTNFTVKNTGTTSLIINASDIDDPVNFQLTGPEAGVSVPPDGTTAMRVDFIPTFVGIHNATVTVSYDDGVNPACVYTLHLTGTAEALPPRMTVTYNGNQSSGGTLPVGPQDYLEGDKVIVLDNTGGLYKNGCTFAGWCLNTQGTGAVYSGGSFFYIGKDNVTLYAKWTAGYSVIYDGNGNTAGSPPVDGNTYFTGDTITIRGNTGGLEKNGSYVSWNTQANGGGTTYMMGQKYTMTAASVVLYARYHTAYYQLRDVGPGGGWIFYIAPDYSAGWRYMEIGPSDIGGSQPDWGCMGTDLPGSQSMAFGTGYQNTIDIIAACTDAGIAARLCADHAGGGYDDWFLPSFYELKEVQTQIYPYGIGNFTSNLYWSSSEMGASYAYIRYIVSCPECSDGGLDKVRTAPYHTYTTVRPARRF